MYKIGNIYVPVNFMTKVCNVVEHIFLFWTCFHRSVQNVDMKQVMLKMQDALRTGCLAIAARVTGMSLFGSVVAAEAVIIFNLFNISTIPIVKM